MKVAIDESDELLRRRIAMMAAKEKVTELVKNMVKNVNIPLDNNGNATIPIKIPLSTMMLITPFMNKAIEGVIRGSESEHNQVADSRYALEYLQYAPLVIQIGDNKYKVEIDTTYMNLSVNIGKKKQVIASDQLQDNVNAQGFKKYCDNIQNYLNEEINKLSKSHGNADLLFNLMSIRDKIENQEYKNKSEELNNFVNEKKNFLSNRYNTLEKLLLQYQEAIERNDTNAIKILALSYKTLKDEISDAHKIIDAKSAELNLMRKENIKNNKNEIKARLDELNSLADKMDDPEKRKLILLQINFIKAQECFLNEAYLQMRNAYQFHALFLLTSKEANQYIEAFCKSAEDRTGWLRVSVLSHMIFREIHGRDADLNIERDKFIFNDIAAAAYEVSASLENTKYNSEARGMQVNGKITHPIVDAGKENAFLAKSVYNDLNKFKPTIIYPSLTESKQESKSLSDSLKKPSSMGFIANISKKSMSVKSSKPHSDSQSISMKVDSSNLQNNSIFANQDLNNSSPKRPTSPVPTQNQSPTRPASSISTSAQQSPPNRPTKALPENAASEEEKYRGPK